MRKAFTLLFLTLVTSLSGQVQKDEEGFEIFTYTEGDTTYTMKKYFVVFLNTGKNRDQPREEAAEIQKKHLEHINWMAEAGYVDLAGPFGDEGKIRGILVMRVPDAEKAMELASKDPAVKAGRLEVEIHPWWAAEGSCLK